MDFGMPFLIETASVEDAAALCSRLGLQFVELNLNFPACALDDLEPDRLMRLREQYGVYFTMHIEEECDPFSFNPLVREAWRQSVRKALRLARRIGTPVLNMHLPHGVYITLPERKVILYEQYDAHYMEAVRSFRTLVEEELEGTSIRISMENTNGFYPNEFTALEELLASDHFGLTLDIGHCHCAGEVDLPFYEAHADRLMHMHAHDARGSKDHLAFGDGDVNLIARLQWAGRNHARVVLETKTIEALEKSAASLEKYLPEASRKMSKTYCN